MGAVDLELLLPDRQLVLDRLDDGATEAEGEITVGAADHDDEREITDIEVPDADADGSLTGTGEHIMIDADLVVRSVGYQGMPLAGVPFDTARGVIPHDEGRVHDGDDVVPGEYVAGWIKRGPTGIIGTNKKDATATVHSLIADAAQLPRAARPDPDAVTSHLSDRGVHYVNVDGWRAIDAAEIALGESMGRARTTLHDRDALLDSARWADDQ